MGASIAYQLTRKGITDVTVVERTAIAASSGGKGGGFLAGGWGDGSVTQALHRRSFELHAELAAELGIESYRKISTLSVRPQGRQGGKQMGGLAEWLDGEEVTHDLMDPSTAQVCALCALERRADEVTHDLMDPSTAQVSPYELTIKMMAAAEAAGARVVIGTCSGVQLSTPEEEGAGVRSLTGIKLATGEVIPCDAAVVAMGVWSTLLEVRLRGACARRGRSVGVACTHLRTTHVVAYSDEKVAKSERSVSFGWEIAHVAVSPRPPISLDTSVSRTEGYTHAASVWDLCIVQGPFSVAPCQNISVTIRNFLIAVRRTTGLGAGPGCAHGGRQVHFARVSRDGVRKIEPVRALLCRGPTLQHTPGGVSSSQRRGVHLWLRRERLRCAYKPLGTSALGLLEPGKG